MFRVKLYKDLKTYEFYLDLGDIMVMLCGIDEAGRGPVIGPLVICGAVIKEGDEFKLKVIGIKDSKLLIPKKREELYNIIKDMVDYRVLVIKPKEIDDALKDEELNLNKLEAIKSAFIINELKPDKAILDCPSNNIKAYEDYLKEFIDDKKTVIKAEHKADMNYIIVSAASIIAKVVRDGEIKKIKEKIKKDFGSGYPSDPKTQDFLKKYYDVYPDIFRKEWASYKEVVNKKRQKSLVDF